MMAQRIQTLEFNDEEYCDELLQNTTALMWSTQHALPRVAWMLNSLFSCHFERLNNITIQLDKQEVECRLFCHQDPVRMETWLLADNNRVEAQQVAELGYWDIMLAIYGVTSGERIKSIIATLEQPFRIRHTIHGERMEKEREALTAGIFDTHTLDFSSPRYPECSLFGDVVRPNAKQKRFLKLHRDYVLAMLLEEESRLPER